MSRKKKIFTLFHFCFALTFFCWLVLQPFVKEVASQKSERALFEMVLERQDLFETLPEYEKSALQEGFLNASHKPKPSMLQHMSGQFFVTTPPFALAWLFFSLAICSLLFFNIEGAARATWLLPLIVICYAVSLYQAAPPVRPSLFPSETFVREHHLLPEETQTLGQREGLLLGWHRYLIEVWGKEKPSADPDLFSKQLEKGLFAFNVARLHWILEGKGNEVVTAGFTSPPSFFRVACYFLWNLGFAWLINRKQKLLSIEAPSNLA